MLRHKNNLFYIHPVSEKLFGNLVTCLAVCIYFFNLIFDQICNFYSIKKTRSPNSTFSHKQVHVKNFQISENRTQFARTPIKHTKKTYNNPIKTLIYCHLRTKTFNTFIVTDIDNTPEKQLATYQIGIKNYTRLFCRRVFIINHDLLLKVYHLRQLRIDCFRFNLWHFRNDYNICTHKNFLKQLPVIFQIKNH